MELLSCNYCHAVTGPPNPEKTIVVENVEPRDWSGRQFDVGIYKDERVLVIAKAVNIADQVDFELQPKLFFAVVRNLRVSQIFTMG